MIFHFNPVDKSKEYFGTRQVPGFGRKEGLRVIPKERRFLQMLLGDTSALLLRNTSRYKRGQGFK